MVLIPYEITLLSNLLMKVNIKIQVLIPYEITLLSNIQQVNFSNSFVLIPYEITLLSNGCLLINSLYQF